MPGAYNPFVARQIARAGFDGVYVSGAGLANSLGMPDDGSLKREDFCYFAALITRAVSLPVLCDADTGLDVGIGDGLQSTVKSYIECGLAGLHVEDQVFPKSCGHLPGKAVIEREQMEEKIRQMAKARDRHDKDFLIIARTDARGAANVSESRQLEESIERGQAYIKAGADMIFPESLRSLAEFKKYRALVEAPLLANMTEFGRTPMLTAKQFEELGYNIVIYPVSLFRFAAGRTREALETLKRDGNQRRMVRKMLNRDEIQRLLDLKKNRRAARWKRAP
jgi:methylisocitrate lyase